MWLALSSEINAFAQQSCASRAALGNRPRSNTVHGKLNCYNINMQWVFAIILLNENLWNQITLTFRNSNVFTSRIPQTVCSSFSVMPVSLISLIIGSIMNFSLYNHIGESFRAASCDSICNNSFLEQSSFTPASSIDKNRIGVTTLKVEIDKFDGQ